MVSGPIDKQFTDRRASVEQQIAFYRLQLEMARRGITERPPEFFERQILYFQMEGAR